MWLKPRPDSRQCLTQSMMEDYLRKALDEAANEAIETHICYCNSCLEALERERHLQESLRAALRKTQTINAPRKAVVGGWSIIPVSGYQFWALSALALVALTILVIPPRSQTSLQIIALNSMRNGQSGPEVKSMTQILLRPNMQGIDYVGPIRLELVEERGETIHSKQFEALGDDVAWLIPSGLRRGNYWLRVYGAISDPILLREFSLRVR